MDSPSLITTNDEVLAVNQDAAGNFQAIRQTRAGTSAVSEIWMRYMADGSKVVGLFNRIGVPMPIRVEWKDIGVKSTKSVRDLWLRQDLPHLGAGSGGHCWAANGASCFDRSQWRDE